MKKTLFFPYLIILLVALVPGVRAQYITTVAGNGTPAYSGDGGVATQASLHGNYGVAVDGSGNTYIADTGNHCIRRVNVSTMVITTVAGTGVAGFSGDGGAATAARLNTPSGIAIDASNNIYIADQLNNRIRFVNASTGIITTIAGTATPGYNGDGISAVTAQLARPFGVTLHSGSLYIADRNNNRVRVVTSGVINTVAGSGTVGFSGDGSAATAANINRPLCVAFDASNILYFVDNGNNRIRSVDASGIINTVAGNGGTTYTPGPATASGLNGPTSMAFDASDYYYIADAGNNAIRYVSGAASTISTAAGTGTSGYTGDCGTPTAARLNSPTGVFVDASGALSISDCNNDRVRRILQPCTGFPAGGTVTATATTGCPFYASTLTVVGAAFGCDITFQWQSSNDGSTYTNISGATTGTITPSLPYSLYFQCVVTCTSSSRSSTSSAVFLNVNPLPVISAITGPTQVCVGSSITVTDTATSGAWSATNTNASVTTAGLVTGLVPGPDTIQYSATNACGTTTASHVVTVYPVVTPYLTISANPGFTVCSGNSVTYTANATNGGSSPSFNWTVNGTFAGTGGFLTYTPSHGDVISCTLTTSAPCATATTAFATDTMSVVGLLTPGVTVTNGWLGDTVCVGTSVTYATAIVNGGSFPTYQWFLNGTPTVTTPTYTYTPSSGDVIGCQITSSFGCASPTTAYDSMLMVVDASETPDVTITAYPGDTSCTGYAVTFTAHARYRGTAPNLIWMKNGIRVATGPYYTFIPVTGDSVQMVFYSNASCRTVDSALSNVMHMVVGPSTTTSVTIAAHPDTVILAGDTDTLSATAVNAGAGATYQWYLNGAAVSGATDANFISNTFVDGDSVYCVVHGSNPCSFPSIVTSNGLKIHVITINSVHNVTPAISAINLVPNPNTGTFYIECTITGTEKNTTVMMTDLLGKTLYSEQADVVNGRIRKQLAIGSDVANGVYMLHVVTNGGRQVVRFNLER